MRFVLLIILFFTNNIFSKEVLISELNNKTPERFLYIGNSYLYYNDSLHNHVRRMLEEYYKKDIDTGNYKSVTISGSRLSHHNIDYYLNYKNIGVDDHFELVIIQGGSGETNTISERNIFFNEIDSMVKKIKKYNSEVALYMVHPLVKPNKGAYPNMIDDIKSAYIEAGNKNSILVFPVGVAFENAYTQKPDIALHKKIDGSHPDMLGTYLAACVIFSSITQVSPKTLSYDYYGVISIEEKDFLQQVAHETVEQFYEIEL